MNAKCARIKYTLHNSRSTQQTNKWRKVGSEKKKHKKIGYRWTTKGKNLLQWIYYTVNSFVFLRCFFFKREKITIANHATAEYPFAFVLPIKMKIIQIFILFQRNWTEKKTRLPKKTQRTIDANGVEKKRVEYKRNNRMLQKKTLTRFLYERIRNYNKKKYLENLVRTIHLGHSEKLLRVTRRIVISGIIWPLIRFRLHF